MARSSSRDYPEFYLVGAAKAGTETLGTWLAQHPEVFLPENRAPRYFAHTSNDPRPAAGPYDRDQMATVVTDAADYLALYAGRGAAMRGDASPCYLAHCEAAGRIAEARPDARIVITLRDPVARAFAHYADYRVQGLDPSPSFEEALAAEPQRLASGWSAWHGYAQQSHYVTQLQRYLDAFPREQILFLSYEALRETPAKVWEQLCAHLGLAPAAIDLAPAAAVEPSQPGTVQRLLDRALPGRTTPAPALSERTRRALAGRYLSEHAPLRRMTGLALENWSTPTG
ncbi:sulfotransferase [Salipiger sp. PrR002]|uniref:sulfotransferase family protein n=1 Tax=Salipiger sp. PrR002 TaxID=2706489 RepID=UPI0013B9D6F2|nr:sulfotransferase [Salipiger sp. PrR002]NDV97734.1 sulfotransferase [Salipiger sp. PrR002]NDW55225.1 sulfotransferase [Salipiger sp. PrR004]